ncbi:type II toxin-antitoxin system RelE/ParE family toxin [soil metagenome]
MKLVWSPLALECVAEIAAYIAEERPHVAEQWVEDIFGAVERLKPFPLSGRVVPEANRQDLREVIHRDFRIIYRVEEHQLSVLTVRHTRQPLDLEQLEVRQPPA